MLAPNARSVAMEVLRPPAGYRLDHAVLTTYSLDLDVLLALPLAVLANSDLGVPELLEDPLLLLQAMRDAGDRLHVFVDEAGVSLPHTSRDLYATLEPCVHPVRARNGGAFHPKVWLVRFVDDEDNRLMRVSVASRNLTFDRSWDVAITSDAVPGTGAVVAESAALSKLLNALPGMMVEADPAIAATLKQLARDFGRTVFPSPLGFKGPISFTCLGLQNGATAPWRPDRMGDRLLAIAPFLNRTGLDALAECAPERFIISRREALDGCSDDALAPWSEKFVLCDTAAGEDDDGTPAHRSGLHAKLIALEHGARATWYIGSANFTAAALTGTNVEMIAAVTGKRRDAEKEGLGIGHFQAAGFLNLCQPYERGDQAPDDAAAVAARARLKQARTDLLTSDLRVVCSMDSEEHWQLDLHGAPSIPDGVTVVAWPVSLREEQSQRLSSSSRWSSLPMVRLTTFMAFRLSAPEDVDDVCFVLKLPATGLPDGRTARILHALIDSPERLLQFLRALLGGVDGLTEWLGAGSGNGAVGQWFAGFDGETLLEDMVRMAAREPQRLDAVRRLLEELQATPEGRAIVPDDLLALWHVVDAALAERSPG